MFKRIDHVEIVTEQFDRTGYGSTDRSIFPEPNLERLPAQSFEMGRSRQVQNGLIPCSS
jgi:hypothetical protein